MEVCGLASEPSDEVGDDAGSTKTITGLASGVGSGTSMVRRLVAVPMDADGLTLQLRASTAPFSASATCWNAAALRNG
jgi:hypothetical protein